MKPARIADDLEGLAGRAPPSVLLYTETSSAERAR
jgi:hypothetical protein